MIISMGAYLGSLVSCRFYMTITRQKNLKTKVELFKLPIYRHYLFRLSV